MMVEVIAICTRAVVRKIAAGNPAFVQMEREGILETLDSQHRVAQQLSPLVAQILEIWPGTISAIERGQTPDHDLLPACRDWLNTQQAVARRTIGASQNSLRDSRAAARCVLAVIRCSLRLP